MQRSQRVCILCQNITRPPQFSSLTRRAASSRTHHEPFDASKLVLDLEAADSKYVRRYEDQKVEDTANPDAPTPDESEFQNKQKSKATLKTRQNIPDIYRATDIDFFAFALIGNPLRDFKPYKGPLARVLGKNLLAASMDIGSFEDKVRYLKEVAETPNLPSHLAGLSMKEQRWVYKQMLRNCRTLTSLSRTTAFITKTVEGCEFLSKNGDVVIAAIKEIRRLNEHHIYDKASTDHVLLFLNALIQKLEAMGVDPGLGLCEAGMYYAAKRMSYVALYRYIELAIQKGYRVQYQGFIALSIAVARCNNRTEGELIAGDLGRSSESRRKDLLRLLTGWDTDGVPREGERRKPSFALLVSRTFESYRRYIIGLGDLGAHRALWYELSDKKSSKTSEVPREGAVTPTERANLFFDAFVAASDVVSNTIDDSRHKLGQPNSQHSTTRKAESVSRRVRPVTTPETEAKSRVDWVAYCQSRMEELREDLTRDDPDGPYHTIAVLEQILGTDERNFGRRMQSREKLQDGPKLNISLFEMMMK